jgi:hypothetical protein
LAVDQGIIQAPADAMAYTLASPLFSDQALKFRTLHLPDGGQVRVTETGRFDYPVGTVISKTFFYVKADNQAAGPSFLSVSHLQTEFPDDLRGQSIQDLALIETRLLVRRVAGWQALPYRWLPDQQDAVLMPAGDLFVADMVSGEAELGGAQKNVVRLSGAQSESVCGLSCFESEHESARAHWAPSKAPSVCWVGAPA